MSNSAIQPILVLLGGAAGVNPTQFTIEKVFARHDLDWRYFTAEVAPEKLADAVAGVRALGFQGGHCDSPHKQAVVPLLDRLSDCAAAVGTVNVLYREEDALVGDNTEGKGVLAALRGKIDPSGKRIALLGSGSLARAIGYELAAAGAAEIRLINRTLAHAQELAAFLLERFPVAVSAAQWHDALEVPADIDVLVHAAARDGAEETPGMIQMETLRGEVLVADVHLDPPCAWLLEESAKRGCATVDGLTIFVEQLAIALERWTGVAPDRQVMRDAVEEFLGL